MLFFYLEGGFFILSLSVIVSYFPTSSYFLKRNQIKFSHEHIMRKRNSLVVDFFNGKRTNLENYILVFCVFSKNEKVEKNNNETRHQ